MVQLNFNLKDTIMLGWRPIPTHTATILVFSALLSFFIGIGIFLLNLTISQAAFMTRYDLLCKIGQSDCRVSINVTSPLTAPVLFSYELKGFYQNMRGYTSSFSKTQLFGNQVPADQLKSCYPIIYNGNLSVKTSIGGVPLDPNKPAYPCGLIANSIFNDTYSFVDNRIKINESDLIWPADSKLYTKPKNCSSICWIDFTNQHFIVWSQLAPSNKFRKIWGRLNVSLPVGLYEVSINNQYNLSGFNLQKYVVLSEATKVGGQQLFLPIMYLISGGISFLAAIYFGFKMCLQKKK